MFGQAFKDQQRELEQQILNFLKASPNVPFTLQQVVDAVSGNTDGLTQMEIRSKQKYIVFAVNVLLDGHQIIWLLDRRLVYRPDQ